MDEFGRNSRVERKKRALWKSIMRGLLSVTSQTEGIQNLRGRTCVFLGRGGEKEDWSEDSRCRGRGAKGSGLF